MEEKALMLYMNMLLMNFKLVLNQSIDAMIPIGKAKELVIGDEQTGKTTVCIDTILNQKNFLMLEEHLHRIYVAIGQKASTVAAIAKVLEEKGLGLHNYCCSKCI